MTKNNLSIKKPAGAPKIYQKAKAANDWASLVGVCNWLKSNILKGGLILNRFVLKEPGFFNKRSKGQHILELALMMPFFIIVFGCALQIMTETYAKYKFSYIFTNAVRVMIQKQPIYKNIQEAKTYNMRERTEDVVRAAFESGSNSPFTNVQVGTISTSKTVYLIGAFQYITKMLFFGDTGKEYFYFIVPINKAYTQPLVLNNLPSDINSYFSKYYSIQGPRREEKEESENQNYAVEGTLD